MTTLREAAQQALAFTMRDFATVRDFEAARAILHDTLNAALEQPEQPVQEPVYWEYKHVDDGLERWNRVVPRTGQTLETAAAEIHGYRRGLKRPYEVRALYTHPPRREWQSLSKEEIHAALPHEPGDLDFVCARAVEAALRSKNHE